ncbi:hypothetical protein D9M68_553910 [compost metagenome]
MEIDHRLLHRMQRPVLAGKMLDGDDMGCLQRAEETDARVDGFIDEPVAGKPSDEHGASAAVALRTTFLGAGQPTLQPQVIEQGRGRCDVGKRDLAIVEDEADASVWLGHATHSLLLHIA